MGDSEFSGYETKEGLKTGDNRLSPPPDPRVEKPRVPYAEQARNMVFAKVTQMLKDGVYEGIEYNFSVDDVHVVWFAKVLKNWKALVVTTLALPDGLYYEVTFNGEKQEVYIDTYVKAGNEAFTYQGTPL